MVALWGLADLLVEETFNYNDILNDKIDLLQTNSRLLSEFQAASLLLDLRDNSYVFVGENINGIFGFTQDEFKRRGLDFYKSLIPQEQRVLIEQYVWPELINYVEQNVKPEWRSGIVFQLNYHMRHQNGDIVYIQESQKPLYINSNGKMLLGCSYIMEVNSLDRLPVIGCIKLTQKGNESRPLYMKNYSMSVLLNKLTPREAEIAKLLSNGLSSKAIGDRLCLSPHTVDTYRRRIIKKLNIKSTAKL